MSEISTRPRPFSKPVTIAAYGLLVIVIAFELVVAWLALHPNVTNDYRAYYITQTTTCMPQAVSGAYVLGDTVSFLPEGREAAKLVRVCGWEGPVGDGTHALGETARLRFVYTQPAGSLILSLTMTAVNKAIEPQRVSVVVNGTVVDEVSVARGDPQDFKIEIPTDVVHAAAGKLEVSLDFPGALKMDPIDSNTRKRSIRLYSARLDAGA